MKVTMTFDVSKQSEVVINTCSVERVINTSTEILKEIDPAGVEEDSAELLEVNLRDWEDCKSVVVNLWNGIRDGIYRVKHEEQDGDYWKV